MTLSRSRPRSSPVFPQRNLPLLLLHARARVIGRFRPIFNEHGVTEQQWRIVRAMLETGPLEQREIVSLCGISSPSLPGVLVRMEALGLVTRERLEHDQRRVKVSLTAKSRSLAARMAPRIRVVYGEIEARLGLEFMSRLYGALDELVAALDAPDDEFAESA